MPTPLSIAINEIDSQTDPTEESPFDVLSKELVAERRIATDDVELEVSGAVARGRDDVGMRIGHPQPSIVNHRRGASAHPSMPADMGPKPRPKVGGFAVSHQPASVIDDGVQTWGRGDLRDTDPARESEATTTSPIKVEFDAFEDHASVGEGPPNRAMQGSHVRDLP